MVTFNELHLCLNIVYCILCITWYAARQKVLIFTAVEQNRIKRRLNRPIPWGSVELFITNQYYYAVTTQYTMLKHRSN